MKNFILLSLVMLLGIFVGTSNVNTAISPDLGTRIEVKDIPGEQLMREIEENTIINRNFNSQSIYQTVYNVKGRRILSARPSHVDDG